MNRTPEAIARRTNVPLEIVKRGLIELEKPDPRSQSTAHEGRRLVRLDPNRDWGWQIVNHGYYRKLRTAEEKRQADTERQRLARQKHTEKKATKCDRELQNVTPAYAFADVRKPENNDAPDQNVEPAVYATATKWTVAILAAYSETLETAGAPVVTLVRANCAELITSHKTEADFLDHCDWCKNGENKCRPKSPAAATEILRWSQWRRMAADELAEQKHRKAMRR